MASSQARFLNFHHKSHLSSRPSLTTISICILFITKINIHDIFISTLLLKPVHVLHRFLVICVSGVRDWGLGTGQITVGG
jgi:hypothetical protein